MFKIAIVGCGAIAEQGHLPGAVYSNKVVVTLLVDKSEERLRQLSDAFSVSRTSSVLSDVPIYADAAVVATPPGTHVAITCELLELGVPVLLEKPIALSSSECRQMINAAERNNILLAAGMTRRLFRSDRWVKELFESQVLGKLKKFTIENGYDYVWPSASNFILSKEQAGGGVLMGLGSHVLDSLIWMIGAPESQTYWCDAEGGIESECRVDLKMSCGAIGSVELSRSRMLSNQYAFEFENGTIEAPFYGDNITIGLSDSKLVLDGRAVFKSNPKVPVESMAEIMARELDDFAHAVQTGGSPMATAAEAMRSIELIERCYASPKTYDFPWMSAIRGGK